MKLTVIATAFLLLLPALHPLGAQESDFEVMRGFEEACNQLKSRIEAAATTATLDTLHNAIASLETRYQPRRSFLDKALYPETFAERMESLRSMHRLAGERTRVIETQGTTIAEYERTIALLTGRIDSLTREQGRMFEELRVNKDLRETVRRLNQAIQLKDRLIFAMADSIFMPYDKDLNQTSGAQKESISRRVLKSNIVARVFDIAADNIKFLEATKLQGKDFASMLEQVQQFETKWSGLREKMNAVAVDVSQPQATKPQTGGKGKGAVPAPVEQPPAVHVDSAIVEWRTRLVTAFWDGVANEFTAKGIPLQPFSDGPTFASSIRTYVDSAKADGRDASVFVNEVWKERIDKEWREGLSREAMLGKVEYASLDKLVSELGEKKVDSTFIAYIAIFVLIVGIIWWFVGRKPKTVATRQ